MTFYTLPDLTGKDPAHFQVNQFFHIYQNNLKLKFETSPVFTNSIRMTVADGSGRLLERDVHWRIEPGDIDQAAMSRAFLEDPEFKGQLASTITIIDPALVGKRVAVNVQQFYNTDPGRFYDDGTPLEVTPALFKALLSTVADIKQQTARVTSPITPIDRVPDLLAFDINAEFDRNKITGEITTVNTVGGGKIIRLRHGAFFVDGLELTYDGKTLQDGVDYQPFMVSALTKQTTSRGGIYHYIALLKDMAGDVSIDYHAVGGEVQRDDVEALFALSASIRTFLNDQPFLTAHGVVNTAAFRSHEARLTIMENLMRTLTSGNPTYGDATANTAVKRPIQASDAKFHWWSIATLYKIQGSTDIITADQFKGRVFLPDAKVSLSFTVDVNLLLPRNAVTITSNNAVFDPTYVLFESVSAAAPVYPMLRVVYNKTSEGLAGAVLQIGLPVTNLQDTMVVEDMSTAESCWLLIKPVPGAPASAPYDTGFLLPDGASIWSQAAASSVSHVHVPVYKPGYLVYSGSTVTLDQLNTSASTAARFTTVLPSYIPLANVTGLIVTVASADGNTVYDVDISLPVLANGSKKGRNVFGDSQNKRITMSATLSQNNTGVYSVSLNTSETASVPADVIRYIRAKV